VRQLTDEEYANETNLKRRDRGYFMELNITTQTEVNGLPIFFPLQNN